MNQYLQTLIQEQNKVRDLSAKISKGFGDLTAEVSAEKLQKSLRVAQELLRWNRKLEESLQVIRKNLFEANQQVQIKGNTSLSFDLYQATLGLYRDVVEVQNHYFEDLITVIEMWFYNEADNSPHLQERQHNTRMVLDEVIEEKLSSGKQNAYILLGTLDNSIERLSDFIEELKTAQTLQGSIE